MKAIVHKLNNCLANASSDILYVPGGEKRACGFASRLFMAGSLTGVLLFLSDWT